MLREIEINTEDTSIKRWFNDEDIDLFIWQDKNNNILKFQLCYDKKLTEKALSWGENGGFSHNQIDDGEGESGKYKKSPILIEKKPLDTELIAEKFEEHCDNINSEIFQFVYKKLLLLQS